MQMAYISNPVLDDYRTWYTDIVTSENHDRTISSVLFLDYDFLWNNIFPFQNKNMRHGVFRLWVLTSYRFQ